MAVESLLCRLDRWSRQSPDKVVFRFVNHQGKETHALTYSQLKSRAEALSRLLLQDLGVAPGDRVMLVYEPSLEFVAAYLACLVARVVAVPCFPPDPRGKAKDLHMFTAIQRSCEARVALTSSSYNFAKKVSGMKAALLRTGSKWPELQWAVTDKTQTHMGASSGAVGGEAGGGSVDYAAAPPADLAFLQYTSGSTSEPKGVMISHAQLAHNLDTIVRALRASERTVVASWLQVCSSLLLTSIVTHS